MSDIETQKQAEETAGIKTSIAPWLTVADSVQALAFYKQASRRGNIPAGYTGWRAYRKAFGQWCRVLGKQGLFRK